MARAHQKQSRSQLAEQKRLWEISVQKYYGKLALVQEYEFANKEPPKELVKKVRRLQVLLENKGAI